MSAVMEPVEVVTGWRYGLSMEDYIAIPALSASGVEEMRVSPAYHHFRASNPRERTPAMTLGTALHAALLEPLLFEARYVALGQCEAVKKDGSPCTNAGSRYRSGVSFCGTHDPERDSPAAPEGVELVAEADLARVNGMSAAVLAHPEARQWFRGDGRSEVTGVWRDEATGVLCKIRVDREAERLDFIHMDVKTTKDASPEAFSRQLGRLGYHRRAAWYRRGLAALGREVTASVLVAVETEARHDTGRGAEHGCVAYLLDEGDLSAVAPEIDRTLAIYARCLESGVWDGFPTGFQPVRVKPWELAANNETETEGSDDD